MFKLIFGDFIRIFRPPTAFELAQDELVHAQRELLKAHTAEEYAHHMANYHAERIERLTEYINQQKDPSCQSNPSNSGTNAHAPIPLKKTSASNSDATWKSSWK